MLVTIIRDGIDKKVFEGIRSELVLKHEPNALSPKYISAMLDGEKIGYVALSPKKIAPGTFGAEDLLNEFNNSGVKLISNCEVVRTERIITTKTETVLVVEAGVGEATTTVSSKEEKSFKLKIIGSTAIFKGKAEVIQDFSKNKDVSVEVKLDGDNIVTSYNGVPAGKVAMKNNSDCSPVEDINSLKKILQEVEGTDIIEGQVYSTATNTFVIQVSVSNSFAEKAEKSYAKKVVGSKKEELIKEGFEEGTLNNIEDYLLANGFSADDINDIFDTYIKYEDKYSHLVPKNVSVLFEDKQKDMLIDAVTSILDGGNILCSGEKGTGKNVFIESLAWVLQRPLFAISINSETDKIDLVGTRSIEPVMVKGEDGVEVPMNKIVFQREVLLDAMACGGVLNVDEINFADPGITGLLHSVCDSRKEIFVPGYGVVKAHSNFTVMATMNVGYEGTNDLNEALSDRFVDIRFENNDGIKAILEKNCKDYQKANLNVCDKIYTTIYNLLKDRDSQVDDSCLTVRGYIQALNMSKRIPIKRALTRCVADKIRDEEYRVNVLEIIENYC